MLELTTIIISPQYRKKNMQSFKKFIDTNIGVSDEEWGLLEKTIRTNHYKKGEIISFKDDIWTDVIYINSGLIRSYIINGERKINCVNPPLLV